MIGVDLFGVYKFTENLLIFFFGYNNFMEKSLFKVGDIGLFEQYKNKIGNKLKVAYEAYKFEEIDLSFLIDASSVYSSKIEGNSLDLNSFMNYRKGFSKAPKSKEIQEIEDLVLAYKFAQKNKLNEKNLLKVHGILAKEFVIKANCGKYRDERVGVFGKSGLVYMAVEPEKLAGEMKNFWLQVADLLNRKLSLEQVFYFASQIHLRFAHLHPFIDGNGRSARVLEKWFLAHHLGQNAWKIAAEEFYWKNRPEYYKSLNSGPNFYETDYSKALPFLLMLPAALL